MMTILDVVVIVGDVTDVAKMTKMKICKFIVSL